MPTLGTSRRTLTAFLHRGRMHSIRNGRRRMRKWLKTIDNLQEKWVDMPCIEHDGGAYMSSLRDFRVLCTPGIFISDNVVEYFTQYFSAGCEDVVVLRPNSVVFLLQTNNVDKKGQRKSPEERRQMSATTLKGKLAAEHKETLREMLEANRRIVLPCNYPHQVHWVTVVVWLETGVDDKTHKKTIHIESRNSMCEFATNYDRTLLQAVKEALGFAFLADPSRRRGRRDVMSMATFVLEVNDAVPEQMEHNFSCGIHVIGHVILLLAWRVDPIDVRQVDVVFVAALRMFCAYHWTAMLETQTHSMV